MVRRAGLRGRVRDGGTDVHTLQALGVGAQVLRRSAVQAANIAQRRLLVSLEISSKDPSYLWFLQWMSSQSARQAALANQPLRGFEGLASRIRSHELAVETKYEQRKDGSSTAEFSLVPGPGTHYFRYKNAWFQVRLVPRPAPGPRALS